MDMRKVYVNRGDGKLKEIPFSSVKKNDIVHLTESTGEIVGTFRSRSNAYQDESGLYVFDCIPLIGQEKESADMSVDTAGE